MAFIYGLVDPSDVGHVRYVGMAKKDNRPYVHSRWAYWTNTKHSHFVHWIKQLHTEGREYQVIILEQLDSDVSYAFLGEVEKMYIAALRQIGHQLTNISDGGYGGDLWKWDDATKEKLRQSRLGKKASLETRIKVGKASASRVRTPEWRAKTSATLIGRKISDEARINHFGKRNALGAVHSEESKERQRAKMLGRKASEETKAKMRAAHAKRKEGR